MLEFENYDASEWAEGCREISNDFLDQDNWAQAEYCLLAAEQVMPSKANKLDLWINIGYVYTELLK